jgi:hypothetical protein
MREILSKTIDPEVPLEGQEWYQLQLFEEQNPLGTRHCNLQIHAVWKDAVRGAMWESEEVEYFWILDEQRSDMRSAKLRSQ